MAGSCVSRNFTDERLRLLGREQRVALHLAQVRLQRVEALDGRALARASARTGPGPSASSSPASAVSAVSASTASPSSVSSASDSASSAAPSTRLVGAVASPRTASSASTGGRSEARRLGLGGAGRLLGRVAVGRAGQGAGRGRCGHSENRCYVTAMRSTSRARAGSMASSAAVTRVKSPRPTRKPPSPRARGPGRAPRGARASRWNRALSSASLASAPLT